MEQAFEEMVTKFGGTPFKRKTEREKRVVREACFAAIKEERGYEDIRRIIKQISLNAERVAQKVRDRVPVKRSKKKTRPVGKRKHGDDNSDDPMAELAATAEADEKEEKHLDDLAGALETPAGKEALFDAIEEAEAEEREAKKQQLPLQRVNRAIKELEQIQLTKDTDDLKSLAKALGDLGKQVDKLSKTIERFQR